MVPKGALYAFPSIRELGIRSEEAACHFVNHGVAMVPGSAFGKFGEGFISISYASSYQKLEQAMDRVEKALKAL